jgi:hypothetical protein
MEEDQMTTACAPRASPVGSFFLLVLFSIAAITFVRLLSHAEKHPESELVRQAMCDPNRMHFRIYISEFRFTDICRMNEKFGVQPFKQCGTGKCKDPVYSEITAYIRENWTSIQDVKRFATEHNWKLVRQTWDEVNNVWVDAEVLVP